MCFKGLFGAWKVPAVSVLAFSISACGGGSSSGSDNDSDTTEYMRLSSVNGYPEHGDVNVSTAMGIDVFINEKIDVTTLNSDGFVLSGDSPVSGSFSYDEAYTRMKFIPDQGLEPYTTYTATFTTDLANLDGLSLEENHSWSFTTGPEVLRVSLHSNGEEASFNSFEVDINSNGNLLVFTSSASNLVDDDNNNQSDIFVHNVVTKETHRVNFNVNGTQRTDTSRWPVISDDGRFVVYLTENYYMYDRDTGVTSRIDVIDPGAPGGNTAYSIIENEPAISSDGRYVAFQSHIGNLTADDTSTLRDIFVRDTVLNTTTLINVSSAEVQANHHSYWPSISADGRYVAFMSLADMLVNNDTNGVSDIFVRDTVNGTTARVSHAAAGVIEANGVSNYPVISGNGRYVAFMSEADNLVPNDNNNVADVFVYDTVSGITSRVSVNSSGVEANAMSWLSDISADGRYVAFHSRVSNWGYLDNDLYDKVFISDTLTNETTILGTENREGIFSVKFSTDGMYYACVSNNQQLDIRDNNFSSDVYRVSISGP